jgi:hypothetical protein
VIGANLRSGCQGPITPRQTSPRTAASYTDAFRLLLGDAQDRVKKPASTLTS